MCEEHIDRLIAGISEMYIREHSFADTIVLQSKIAALGSDGKLFMFERQKLFRAEMNKCIRQYVEGFVTKEPQSGHELIRTFFAKWDKFEKRTSLIEEILNAFTSSQEYQLYIGNQHKLSCQAKRAWKKKFADTQAMDIADTLLREIKMDRNGDSKVDRQLLRQAIKIFYHMDEENCNFDSDGEEEPDTHIYELAIEKPILEQIRQEYDDVFKSNYRDDKGLDYFAMCLQHLECEDKRIASRNIDKPDGYIPLQTGAKILDIAKAALINERLSLIYNEFAHLLQTDQIESLNVIYRLSSYFPETGCQLVEQLEKHMVAVGEAAIAKLQPKSKNVAIEYVEAIIGVYQKYRRVITEQLGDNCVYRESLFRALNAFINNNEITRKFKSRKAAEYFAHYCDQLLRQWAKRRPNGEEVRVALDAIGRIFNSLNEMDVFELLYSQEYAKRIVGAITLPDSEEVDVIARFKEFKHTALLRRIESLNKDALLSRELTEQFKAQKFATSFALNICVIQQNCWPLTGVAIECTLPPVLSSCVEEFTQFYKNNQNTKRKLNWVHHHSRGELSYYTPKKTYVLELSTHQMCLLLMFNDRTSCTLEELAALTSLPIDVLIENLEILIDNELIVASAGDVMDKNSELALNMNYSNVKRMVHLKQRTATKKTKDADAANESLYNSRILKMQAAVVRIMKRDRVLDANTIFTKIVEETNRYFIVDMKELKLVLNALVDREYIREQEDNTDKYEYLV